MYGGHSIPERHPDGIIIIVAAVVVAGVVVAGVVMKPLLNVYAPVLPVAPGAEVISTNTSPPCRIDTIKEPSLEAPSSLPSPSNTVIRALIPVTPSVNVPPAGTCIRKTCLAFEPRVLLRRPFDATGSAS